jgi:4-hydroxy-tetrahydrodipicolinate synthase
VADDATPLRGIWAAVLTPIGADLQPDASKAIADYRELLERGCDGINLLGTTGEAMSFSTTQRLGLMEAVARSGLPMRRAMVGTGAASLDDAARLTASALDLGFAAVLVMPPFFFREPGDDGVRRLFDALFARVPAARGRVLLYNFPLMSGITFHPDLVDRLVAEYPDFIVGLKDSSNDRDLQREIIARHPQFAIFPGSEEYLLDAVDDGAAGCISGSVALWPELARSVYRDMGRRDAVQLAERRRALAGLPFVAVVRHCVARASGDDGWERSMPPLAPLTPTQRGDLERRMNFLQR